MIVQCTNCLAKFKFDEKKLSGSTEKKVKCTKCGQIFSVLASGSVEKAGADFEIEKAKPTASRTPTGEFTPLDEQGDDPFNIPIKPKADKSPSLAATGLDPAAFAFEEVSDNEGLSIDDLEGGGFHEGYKVEINEEAYGHKALGDDEKVAEDRGPLGANSSLKPAQKKPAVKKEKLDSVIGKNDSSTIELDGGRQFGYGSSGPMQRLHKNSRFEVKPISGVCDTGAKPGLHLPKLLSSFVKVLIGVAIIQFAMLILLMAVKGDRFNITDLTPDRIAASLAEEFDSAED